MSDDSTLDRTGTHAGAALVDRAKDSGGWKAVVDWIAEHPQHAEGVARFHGGDNRLTAALSVPSVRSGHSIGGIELKDVLGSGAMGVVYRGYDPVLRREVAVKIVRTEQALSPLELARFELEREWVASLGHANIVPVLSSGDADGVPYMVMPLLTGGSLAAWLKSLGPDRQLDPQMAARMVREIALGVHHAHDRGLIHRDLKPANILLDGDRKPMIADFGIARRIDATLTETAAFAGTVPYMAPEQARAEKDLTKAVDIHALGAILFELLTGRTPFAGGDIAEILHRVMDEEAPLVRTCRRDVPADLEAICLMCLEKNPGQRYPSALTLAEDLDRFLMGEAPVARPPGFWDWLRQLSRTKPDKLANESWPVTAWLGLLILLTNIAVYAMVKANSPAIWIWASNLPMGLTEYAVLWWYMLRRFRSVAAVDRHSLIMAVGAIGVFIPMMAIYVPLSISESARSVLPLFPPMLAIIGLCFFILGSTNWSRFFPIGIVLMAAAPLLTLRPEIAPLLYGGLIAGVLWYWSYVSRDSSISR